MVIELKRGQTSDDTNGQILRYMSWIEINKSQGETCKGIIVAGHFDKKLHYAVKKIQDVELFEYKLDFQLKKIKEQF